MNICDIKHADVRSVYNPIVDTINYIISKEEYNYKKYKKFVKLVKKNLNNFKKQIFSNNTEESK